MRFDQVYIDFRNGLDAHDRIAIEVLRDDLAAVAEDDLAPRGGAQAVDDPAFNLGADQIRIDRDPAIEDEDDALHVDALSFIARDFDDLRAMAEEVAASNPARSPFRKRRIP